MQRKRPPALDDPDAALDALDPATRAKLAAIWAMRAGMELHVAGGFAVIARELLETGADEAVLHIAARAVDDELAHAAICLDLAKRHDGATHPWPAPEPLYVPSYEGATGALLACLHLTAMSCLNETVASVRLAAAADASESPVVARALRAILADEVEHARAGWAHLASRFVSTDHKAELARRLPTLLQASLTGLLDENAALPPEGFRTLGLPSVSETRSVALAAIDEVVLPGFERVGVDTSAARTWRGLQPPHT